MIHDYITCPECESREAFIYERGPVRQIKCMDCDYEETYNIGWKGSP